MVARVFQVIARLFVVASEKWLLVCPGLYLMHVVPRVFLAVARAVFFMRFCMVLCLLSSCYCVEGDC